MKTSELSKCVLNCRLCPLYAICCHKKKIEEKEAVKQNVVTSGKCRTAVRGFGDNTTLVKCSALRCAVSCTAAQQQKYVIWNTVSVCACTAFSILNAP